MFFHWGYYKTKLERPIELRDSLFSLDGSFNHSLFLFFFSFFT